MRTKLDHIIVVEGYMDVIACHNIGQTNVVGVCGTAITIEQLKLLQYYANKLYFAFDNDEAGQKATFRALELAVEAGWPHNSLFVVRYGLPNTKENAR